MSANTYTSTRGGLIDLPTEPPEELSDLQMDQMSFPIRVQCLSDSWPAYVQWEWENFGAIDPTTGGFLGRRVSG